MNDSDKLSKKQKSELLMHLRSFISEHKNKLFDKIIKDRTRHITVVLEDIFQPHNASAVLRSCDCFGVQDVHIIENKNQYNVNPDVALGASKWLSLFKYNSKENNTVDCINELRKQGYIIVATVPDKDALSIEKIDVKKKMAMMFGTELEGLSEQAINNADLSLYIPMYGFTESLNISVSAAMIMFSITNSIRKNNVNWQLSDEEMLDIQIGWARSVVKDAYLIEKEFIKRLL